VPPRRLGPDDDPGAEDATGSKPSRITARRRKKQQREREAAAHTEDPESVEAPD
jgi:hypothetical protein